MAEAPTAAKLDISGAPRVDAPPPRFMPAPMSGEAPAPADSPTQPRSAGAITDPVSRIISQVPPAERPDPKFIPPAEATGEIASADHSSTIEGSGGQRFQTDPPPTLKQRLLSLIGRVSS